ncbi:hypothetical protein M408DRAFT_25954 [Serendipita vermifera MAFF 305830]|uniref:N-acetyltransferase domain-containing protein n=1 Tax=Serendipita vermifera MAFF 305830 TaxID=933852 RepID=A0A0C3A512_SERVB|nr:hypothetical protein M408DRAFT_30959 [Serendipita vermifera MAFF 305830]KIM25841.1 hypothetical protein M408DRAFT_25954 [Serendipita vermifera MAFF 305830]
MTHLSSNSPSTTSMDILWRSQDDKFFISDSKELFSFEDLRKFLEQQPRWKGVTQAIWDVAASHVSVAILGVYKMQQGLKPKQVGVSRVISDGPRFTFLADFFILPSYRGMGLGKALLAVLLASPSFGSKLQRVNIGNSIELRSLLQKYGGFKPATFPDAAGIPFMIKQIPNEYESHDECSSILDMEHVQHPSLKEYYLSTRTDLIQLSIVYEFLKTAFWSKQVEQENLPKEVATSDCISIFYKTPDRSDAEPEQVGFARWATDRVTFAYLLDVFIVKEHRGKGLGIWLVQQAMEMPAIRQRLPHADITKDIFPRLIMLRTLDAQGLYSRYAGFTELQKGGQGLGIMLRDST